MDKTLVLFDFDGTITSRDTLLELIKFRHGKAKFYAGMVLLLPFIAMNKARLISNQRLKEIVMTFFWKNTDAVSFADSCTAFCNTVLGSMIRKEAVARLKVHVQSGHDVAVVSASAKEWVQPFCDAYAIRCLSSELEIADNKITGKLVGLNCNGDEKVNRIKAVYDIAKYSNIIAYGDSSGDKPMLQLASQAHFRPFR